MPRAHGRNRQRRAPAERAAGLVCSAATTSRTSRRRPSRSARDRARNWYQYYFHGERGRAGLEKNRREYCKLLWRLWSPAWRFDAATYERTAVSFENPDFVDVVIHSYRHRFALVAGDPAYAETERRIAVPTVTFD